MWAIGDCAMCEQKGLPPIAQAAMQQGAYFAMTLNKARGGPQLHRRKNERTDRQTFREIDNAAMPTRRQTGTCSESVWVEFPT